jgi:hypothetical protein
LKPSLGTVEINLPVLLESRMLVQANSGAGKSWTLRRILEQTAAGVQQLVIDPEGEFASLREKFDYIVCAPHGADAVATPQTAAALARALWESGTSAILDIYELKAHERILFVRRFLEALINAPKSIWHPTLVAIDEIQMFAPQVGSAESLAAVIDLASRGRKRGLALVGATQRLSKLHKDVAAELLNKVIMRTGLDVDVQRAADELGLARAGAAMTLRELEPGEAFVFGPALTRGVERTRIGPVLTSHPKTGQRGMVAPPPASKAVLSKLAKIEGLQRAAEEEVKTVASLSTELANVRRELTIAKKAQTGVPEPEVQRRIKEAVAAVPRQQVADLGALKALQSIAKLVAPYSGVMVEGVALGPLQIDVDRLVSQRQRAIAVPTPPAAGLTSSQQRILDSLAWLAAFGVPQPTRECLSARAGVPHTSGGYKNNLGALRSGGLIDYPTPGTVALTDGGQAKANAPTETPTLRALHEAWLGLLTSSQAAILSTLLTFYPEALTRGDLARRVGVPETSGGFKNNLGRLRTLGAIEYPQAGDVRATDLMFPSGVRR